MSRLFGTDGVRGVANVEITPELAFQLGYAGAVVLARHATGKPSIIVGTDTRISKDMLQAALVSGITAAGADAHLAGVVPTPCVAYLTRKYGMHAGVVISASHNSFEYNGIKFFSAQGYKLPDDIEDEIEQVVRAGFDQITRPAGTEIGTVYDRSEAAHDYAEHLKRRLSVDLTGLKIAVDCAHGASYAIAPALLSDLGAAVVAVGIEPDGVNINAGCGSTHLELLQNTVRTHRCDLGLAFDGDADRLLVVASNGDIIDGDIIMAIMASDMMAKGTLKHNTLVVTQMSNLGLDIWAKQAGVNVIKTKVGDRYVLEAMLEGGYSLGGEQSGHFIVLEHTTTGDGLLSALHLLNVLVGRHTTIDAARTMVKILPQILKNAKVRNGAQQTVLCDEKIMSAVQNAESTLAGRGRVLVRASGTEPLIRVMLEGEDIIQIRKLADDLISLIAESYGV